MRRCAPVGVLAAGALLVTGCGGDGRLEGEVENTRGLSIVSAKSVDAAPPASPERAFLRWWRLLQYRDPADALELMTEPAVRKVTEIGFDELVHRDFGPWAARVRPTVERVDRVGDTATVFARLRISQPVGRDLVRRSEERAAFPLRRAGREWKLSSAAFFAAQSELLRENRLREQRAAERARR